VSRHALLNKTVYSNDWLITAEATPPPVLRNPEILVNVRTDAEIKTLSWSPDGQSFATGLRDGSVDIWPLRTRSLPRLRTATHRLSIPHDLEVLAVALNHDGDLLAIGNDDGIARICDGDDGTVVHRLRCGSVVNGVSFSPDSSRLATAGDCLYVWDLAAETPVMLRAGATQAACFSPGGEVIAAVFPAEHKVLIVDAASGKVVTAAESRSSAGFLAFSPDGARFAAGRDDEAAAIWDAGTGELITVLAHRGVRAAAFSPDGTMCATAGSDQYAALWDAATGEELIRIRHPALVRSVAFGPDSNLLGTAADDSRARIWKISQ
jgi:WD40 repeat protein